MPAKKLLSISRKTTKRLVPYFKSFGLILLVLVLAVGIVFIFKSKFFSLNVFNCSINSFPCKKESYLFEELRGKNIFLANTTKLAEKIESQILTIEEVRIKKQLPNKIKIEIIPRVGVAVLTTDDKIWFLIDKNGFIFKKTFTKPEGLVIINTFSLETSFYLGQKINDQWLVKTLLLIKSLDKNFVSFKKIVVLSRDNISLFLHEAVIASFSAQKNISQQVDSLQFILRQSKIEGKLPAYIDLRFTKPVIK